MANSLAEQETERRRAAQSDLPNEHMQDLRVRAVELEIGSMRISRMYPVDDLIWELPSEKRERKAMADCQRDLVAAADRLSQEPLVIRG